ncbi:LppU/SCO3897 family protein [[Mycobacterium] wendilense]|uniref:Uncharacterized protein n=1 Tax=[Mycobacterium] wendilense TaxID=3064284 RepID=A0ABM9MFX9_9MYCO|nr:hypothetical protein [Mycolicibacterium sp. MU0050]CAJ1584209.1 hypothetical protein MU0050_003055 [Mycolicibacterium sp. MU0050]
MVELFADDLVAYRLGSATAALIFPLAGALLLAVGLYRRRAHRRWVTRDAERLLQNDDTGPANLGDHGPSRPAGRGTVFLVIGSLVTLLGIGHVLSALADTRAAPPSASNLNEGQCITAEDFAARRLNVEAADCSSSDATLQLASKGDATASCPDGSRGGARYPLLTSGVRTYCFMFNLREGRCYALGATVAPADCADPAANVRVIRRVDGVVDDPACPPAAKTVVYRETPRAYCFVAPPHAGG